MTYTYDNRRKVTLQAATASGGLASKGVDDTIQSIKRSYDSLGRTTYITSYADAAGTTVKNQIRQKYNWLGRLEYQYQQHDGAVNTSTSPKHRNLYDTTQSSNVYTNGLRKKLFEYPLVANAKVFYYYGGTIDDRLGRVRYHTLYGGNFNSNKKVTSQYQYNGTGRLVETYAYTASGGGSNNITKLKKFSSTGNYSRLDRFGRTTSQRWDKGNTSTVIDQFDYTYDYASNRLTRDVVGNTTYDQKYAHDDLHRLTSQETGNLVSGSITSLKEKENFILDQLGNWSLYAKDANGDGAYTGTSDNVQFRTHDEANQLSIINENSNADWVTAAHDAAGNMTTIPQPKAPTAGYTAKYDAWNRLVELKDSSSSVVKQTNTYDGLNRRIKRVEPTKTRHFYYNENWQVLTESDGTNATAIYSYHPQYIDAVAVKVGPTTGHFYLHDANFNVTAAIDLTPSNRPVVERYHYSPYGEVTILNGTTDADSGVTDFSPDADNKSDIGNEHLYTGRRLDPETGLQLNRRRFYHARLGRWINVDPIGYLGGGYNLFEYVGGRPTIARDPLGLRIWTGIDPESSCCKNPIPRWKYWKYKSSQECVSHVLLMTALQPGGQLFGFGTASSSVINKLIGTGNWAGLIAKTGASASAAFTARASCNQKICVTTNIVIPKCSLYTYHAFGQSWLWECHRVHCACPAGSVHWPQGRRHPIHSPYDGGPPEWNIEELIKQMEKDLKK